MHLKIAAQQSGRQNSKSPKHVTASTAESAKRDQQELVPSFLKALYITSDDTIFDDDAAMTGIDCVSLGLKSLTHSADTHLSQNDVLRVRMAEMNRSKSALSSNQSGLDAPLK